MRAKVTNAWSAVTEERDGAPALSRIVVESTFPPARWRLLRPSPTEWTLELQGLSLNMPAGRQEVWDGLVAEFRLEEASPERVLLDVLLEHPAEAWVEVVREGLPVRTILCLDRGFVGRVMAGRTVAVDPGHGGRDAGARGPINLLEKDVVLDVARRLAAALSAVGARPVLTRRGDEDVTSEERVRRAAAAGAECLVSLHTGHAWRPYAPGTRTLYAPGAPGGPALAACLHRAVLCQGRRPDRGLGPGGHGLPARLPFPAACVELVCLADPLEEAWLRNPSFKDRLARGVVNGLKDYFAGRGEARPPQPAASARGPAAAVR